MTNTPNSSLHDLAGTPSGDATEPDPVRPVRRRSAGHITAIVIGSLTLLPGLGILAGGTALAIAQAAATDDDGYFRFTLDRVESEGVAVATTHLWLDDVDGEAGPWVLDWLDLDLRLRVEGAASTDDVFVGIARSADVERYLSDATYSEVTEIDHHTPIYREVPGATSIGSPLGQEFWTVSTAGSGEQELTWDARGGRWSVVVMNADGSPNVNADIEIGARSSAVTPIAVTLIVIGGLTTAFAIMLIVVGVRGRRTMDAVGTGLQHGKTPFPPPPPNTAARLDDEVARTTPAG